MPQEIQKTLIDELGLSDLPADKKDQLMMKMTEAVLKRIFLETMEKLNDKDQEEYAKMIEEEVDPEKLDEFLQGKISGYEEIVKHIVADFVAEMKKVNEE